MPSLRWIPLCGLLFSFLSLQAGPVPEELAAALRDFRSEGPFGWAFTQTTVSGDKSLVESYDPTKPEVLSWTLVQKDGRPPTAEETKDYREKMTRRTRGDTAPNVKDQLDTSTCELISSSDDRRVYRFRLRPGDKDDTSAAFMAASFTLHTPTGTIEQVELASTEPFSPVFLVKVAEARTVLRYSLPSEDQPSLLQAVTLKIRGRSLFFRSLDQDMTVTYSDHRYAGRLPWKASLPAAPAP